MNHEPSIPPLDPLDPPLTAFMCVSIAVSHRTGHTGVRGGGRSGDGGGVRQLCADLPRLPDEKKEEAR